MDEPPIGDLALIGDGRASALIDRQATIRWMALPEDDRIAVFDALVSPDVGGRFSLHPAGRAEVSRRYLPGSVALETTFETSTGSLTVTDCLTLHNGARLPWVELARRVHCQRGAVDLEWSVEPSLHLGEPPRPLLERHGMLQAEVEGVRIGVLHWGLGDVTPNARGAGGRVRLVAGDDALLAAVVVVEDPLPRPDRGEVEARVDRTIQTWRTWSGGIEYAGRWRDQVHQSARVLKLLIHEPDGAILAAPTTSLPERLGGDRNYDYRFCWTRDASFTIDALLRIGLVEEAHRAVTSLLRKAHRTAPHLAPFYRVDGSMPDDEVELDVRGYRGSRPVRRGNAAGSQLQLGNWGDLFETVWIYVRRGNDLDRGTSRLLSELADHVCEIWTEEDAGMWELSERRHYTVSKMGCWAALDRACRLADRDQLDGDVGRWRADRQRVADFIHDDCWSDSKGSFSLYAGSDDLDAACLLAARLGVVDGSSEQMLATIEAVQSDLAEGPFVWRYSGQRSEEGAFLACSFWLAEALTRAGRLDEAADQLDGTLAAMSDAGLLAEQYEPGDGELLGNHPQGLSHLALIAAATHYTEVATPD